MIILNKGLPQFGLSGDSTSSVDDEEVEKWFQNEITEWDIDIDRIYYISVYLYFSWSFRIKKAWNGDKESVEGVNVYNEESKLVDLLQFIYRTNKHYILTYIIQSFGTKIDIFEYYRKIWKKSDGNLQEKQIISIIQTIER